MSKYKCLIFDVDNTLLDYEASADLAIQGLLLKYNIDCDRNIQDYFKNMCNELWKAFDLNMLNLDHIRKNYHELYKTYNYRRFEVFKEYMRETDLTHIDTKTLTEEYGVFFNHTHVFENHALDVLKQCSKTHVVAAATNGLSTIQRNRLKPIERYLSHIFISEEMGCVKPMPKFYGHMLSKINLCEKDCLFIGDLYSTDILGALNAHMDACWYRPLRRDNAQWLEATHSPVDHSFVIDSLDQLLEHI